ncbi:DUF3662 domain-containing protein [candidate division KSB1 bacterium]|nr:DUF3662 domain-containing protein [candidate division KSB1 bacterium]
MGLKDKVKGIWKRVSDLEDETDSTDSPSKNKKRIPYKDISQKLKEVMKQNVDVVGRKIIIPAYYTIYLNETDRKLRIEVEDVLCEELKEELYHEMRKINPEQNKRELLITVQTDSTLPDGQFRIEHHIKKPEASEKIIKEQNFEQASGPENEGDYQQTVVEQTPAQTPDDEQKTVVQKVGTNVLYRLLVDSGEEKREIEITKETTTIGRGTKDDICLQSPDYSISRSHAIITLHADILNIRAQGINGTLLNGQELELNRETRISAGDEITILNYRIKIL